MVTTERQADSGRLVDTQPPQGQRAPIDNTPPRVFSIRLVRNRQPTVSDVIWHVIFSEPVRNVSQNGADFRISGTDAPITVRQVGDIGRMYVVIASVGDLGRSKDTLTLSFAGNQDVEDAAGNALTDTTPTGVNDNTFTLDTGVTDREDTDGTPAPIGTANDSRSTVTIDTVPPTDRGTAPREDPGEDNAGVTASAGDTDRAHAFADHNDGTASGPSNGNAALNAAPRTNALDLTFPLIESLVRWTPSAYRTSADSVTWRITFTEEMRNVDKADFMIIGIRPWSLTVTKVNESSSVYDITLNSYALADHNGTVALALSPSRTIEDLAGNDLVNRSLSGEVEFVIDSTGAAPHGETGGAAASEHTGSTAMPEGDDGLASGEDSSGAASADDTDSAPSPKENGGLPSPAEPATPEAERIYPRIRSLVRLQPPAYRTNADSLTWRITFSEPVTNVDERDFVIIGTPWRLTVTKVGESGDAYDIALDSNGLADHNGPVTLAFSRGMYVRNLDGNRLLNVSADGPYETSFVIDNAAPGVTFNPESGRIDDTGGNLILSFSEAVYSDSSGTAFTETTLAELIDLREDDESGAPIPFTVSIDQDSDTVTIDPTGTLPLRAWVRVKDGYYDTVGNEGGAATAAFTLDTTRPTVTIDGVPATDSGAFMAIFTFSEAVTGFAASDVAVTNGTASALTEAQAGLQWLVRIAPTGDYSVTLPADRVTDLAGNGNAASTSREGAYGADVTDPRLLSIVRQTPPSSPVRADSITWRVTFSEDVEQFNANSVGLLDHRSQVPIAGIDESVTAVEGSASVYDVTFSGSALANHNDTVRLGFLTKGSADNWVSVNVRDTSNRPLPCCQTLAADERTFDVDNVAPRVADIVRSSPGREHTNDDEVAWTVTFSEPVRNLSAGDFTVSGTDAALSVTPEGSGSRTWSVIASGGNLARLNATIRLSFADTRDIKDAAGNVLVVIAPTGADESTFVIDNIAPALTSIVRQPPKSSPADAETATWRLTFSEDMRGIEAADFAVHGATIAVVAAGSKAVYDLSVSGQEVIPVRAPISVYINRESNITDLAGNALRAPRPPTTIVLPSSVATSR